MYRAKVSAEIIVSTHLKSGIDETKELVVLRLDSGYQKWATGGSIKQHKRVMTEAAKKEWKHSIKDYKGFKKPSYEDFMEHAEEYEAYDLPDELAGKEIGFRELSKYHTYIVACPLKRENSNPL